MVAPLIGLVSIYGTLGYTQDNQIVTRMNRKVDSMKGTIEAEILCPDIGNPIYVAIQSLQPDTWWLHSIHIVHPSGSQWVAPCYHWFDDDCFLTKVLATYPYVLLVE
jgi:hypothetical protein